MMTLMIAGMALWMMTHFFKRVTPGLRAGFDGAVGVGPAKGIISGLIVASIVLMVIGYRGAGVDSIYVPMAGMGHLNNLLMLVAVMLSAAGNSKGRMRSLMRHPMLVSVLVWTVAHLLVNGDLASIILFGGIGVWALLQMLLINRAEPDWTRPEPGPIKGDIKLLVISLVVFAVIAGIHIWLGHNPFQGTYG